MVIFLMLLPFRQTVAENDTGSDSKIVEPTTDASMMAEQKEEFFIEHSEDGVEISKRSATGDARDEPVTPASEPAPKTPLVAGPYSRRLAGPPSGAKGVLMNSLKKIKQIVRKVNITINRFLAHTPIHRYTTTTRCICMYTFLY